MCARQAAEIGVLPQSRQQRDTIGEIQPDRGGMSCFPDQERGFDTAIAAFRMPAAFVISGKLGTILNGTNAEVFMKPSTPRP